MRCLPGIFPANKQKVSGYQGRLRYFYRAANKQPTPLLNQFFEMKAYVIVDVTITDPSRYEQYKKLTPASLEPFGGKFIVRGGNAERLEGDWQPGRIVVLEFPSLKKAKEWWSSELYAPAKAMRQSASVTQMIVVEGV